MRFMVQAIMKQELTEKDYEEVMALLPAQVAMDEEHIKQRIREHHTLVAADRSTVWLVLNCESQGQAQEILQTFPLYKYSDWSITPLLNEEDNVPR